MKKIIILMLFAFNLHAQTVSNFVSTGLTNPRGICFDSTGNTYVSKLMANTISKISVDGTVSTFVPSTGNISRPASLIMDAMGNLYVASLLNNAIYKVTSSGQISIFASGLSSPAGLAFDSIGNLYVSNQSNGTISKIRPSGLVSYGYVIGLSNPVGLVCDNADNLLIANLASNTIVKVRPTNGLASTIVTGLSSPTSLAYDSTGNLYVSSYGTNTISKITPTGSLSTFVAATSGLNGPIAIAYNSSNNNLYVACYIDSSVKKISLQPTPPTNLVATATINGASIAFTAPTNDGGAAITSYEYTINDGVSWTTIASATSPLNITGLAVCTNHTIKIRAVNAAGGGTASAAVTVILKNGVIAGNWTIGTSAADHVWSAVTYGNGLFVAVSATEVMTSPDGFSWTLRTCPESSWRSITYGNGLFVAVGTNNGTNILMTSPDGINWTSRTSAANNVWTSVTYGNGLFVAVAANGSGNRVMTSSDGLTWTIRASAADNGWNSVTYGNGLFVAVAGNGTGNRVMTSPDGTNWTIGASAADSYWNSVTYGNGKFVAGAISGTGIVMTSPDGITWTIGTSSSTPYSMVSVAYGNGLFATVSQSGYIWTSPDGINWSFKTGFGNMTQSVIYGNGKFVAVAYTGTGNRVITSSDAFVPDSPSITTISPTGNTAAVAFTAPADSGSSAITNYQYSIDNGSTWVTPSPAVTTSPLTITGLTGDTTYNVQLLAVNSAGASCTSATMSTRTLLIEPTAYEQTFCGAKTVANLTATGANLKWYDVAINGTVLESSTALSSGTYYVSQTPNGLESDRTSVAVIINTPPTAPTVACYQTATLNNTTCTWDITGTQPAQPTAVANINVVITGGLASLSGQYINSGLVNGYYDFQMGLNGYIAHISYDGTKWVLWFYDPQLNYFISNNSASDGLYPTTTGWSSPYDTNGTLTWSYASVPVTLACYQSYVFNGTSCVWDITGTPTPAPTAAAQTFSGSQTVADLVATGTNLQWYDVATNGTALATSTALVAGTYYVSQTLNGCEGTRTVVVVTEYTFTPTPTASAQTFCGSKTVADLFATGTDLKWYAVATDGTALDSTTALVTGTYYVTQTVNGNESARTSVAVTVNTTPAPNVNWMSLCSPTVVADLIVEYPTTGTEFNWYSALTGGTALATNTTVTSGNYYVSKIVNGCESTRTLVDINIVTTLPPAAAAQTFCNGATVSNLVASLTTSARMLAPVPNVTLTWYDVATGGTALTSTTLLTSGTYYVSKTENRCESLRTAVAVTITSGTSNTTIASACDSYTWSLNGTTYTSSGVYSLGTGCHTEILNLTIIPNSIVFTTQPNNSSICNKYGTINLTAAITPIVGATYQWQVQTATGTTWENANNSSVHYSGARTLVLNIQQATVLMNNNKYKLVVTAPSACSSMSSDSCVLTVDPISLTGLISGGGTICENSAKTLRISNWRAGTMQTIQWQASTVGATTGFTDIEGATGSIYTTDALTATTYYRAVITSGVCDSRTSLAVEVTVIPAPVAGIINGGNVTVCTFATSGRDLSGTETTFSNNTLLSVAGTTGAILWQKSTNYENATGTTPVWTSALSTTNELTVTDLTADTWFRVLVTNSACSVTSDVVKITVTKLARAGVINSYINGIVNSASVCSGGDIIFISTAFTGSDIKWEVSTTSATSGFEPIAYANGPRFSMNSVTYPPLTSFYVRSVVRSGDCSIAISGIRKITVSPQSVAGTVTGGGIICPDANGIVKVTGYTGVIQWQSSTDGISYVNVPTGSATSATYSATNITADTYFRAKITSGICSEVYSNAVQFTIGTASAGTLTAANETVCKGTGTTLTLNQSVGTIKWWKSINWTAATPTWTVVTSTAATVSTGNLTVSTAYKAEVTIGTCSTETSQVVPVMVYAAPLAKAITANVTSPSGASSTLAICTTSTSKVLTIGAESVGAIQWQRSSTSSTSGFVDITDATATSYTVTNPAVGANYFRAKFTNSCGASVFGTAFRVYYKECTPTKAIASSEFGKTSFAVVSHPNPFTSNFNLDVTTSSSEKVEVLVYDMIGRLLEKHQENVSEINTLEIGTSFPAGVYNIIVTQGMEVKTVRVIKK